MASTDRPFRVYFIDDGTAVKIGIALNPAARLDDLQTGNPRRLDLIGSIEGDLGDERALHEQFATHRLVGEWFERRPVREWLGIDPPPAPPGVAALREFLSRSPSPVATRDIQRHKRRARGLNTAAGLAEALAWLAGQGEVRLEKRPPPGGIGRPTTFVHRLD